MKILIMLLVLLSSFIVYGQQWYNSDYTICTHQDSENWSLNEYMEVHEIDKNTITTSTHNIEYVVLMKNKKYVLLYEEYRTSEYDNVDIIGLNTVYYNSFTNEPAFAFIYSGDSSTMENMVENFDLQEYLNSYMFELDLRRILNSNSMSDLFIIERLGKPTKTTRYTSRGDYTSDFYKYDDLRVILNFINNKLSSYYRY